MIVRHLQNLLHGLADTRELVVAHAGHGDVLQQVWRAAQDEADVAYGWWCERPGRERYCAYRAAADRADAALDALIASR
jgi:hypothetical protein